MAKARNTGARALRAIMEEVMLEIMYKLPSLTGVQTCTITEETVCLGTEPLLIFKKSPVCAQKRIGRSIFFIMKRLCGSVLIFGWQLCCDELNLSRLHDQEAKRLSLVLLHLPHVILYYVHSSGLSPFFCGSPCSSGAVFPIVWFVLRLICYEPFEIYLSLASNRPYPGCTRAGEFRLTKIFLIKSRKI